MTTLTKWIRSSKPRPLKIALAGMNTLLFQLYNSLPKWLLDICCMQVLCWPLSCHLPSTPWLPSEPSLSRVWMTTSPPSLASTWTMTPWSKRTRPFHASGLPLVWVLFLETPVQWFFRRLPGTGPSLGTSEIQVSGPLPGFNQNSVLESLLQN